MRSFLLFAALAVTHFVLTFASLFIGGGIVMAAFDGEGSSLSASLASFVIRVLTFPVAPALRLLGMHGLGSIAGHAVVVLNSMLWSLTALLVWSLWRRRRRAPVPAWRDVRPHTPNQRHDGREDAP